MLTAKEVLQLVADTKVHRIEFWTEAIEDCIKREAIEGKLSVVIAAEKAMKIPEEVIHVLQDSGFTLSFKNFELSIDWSTPRCK